MTFTKSQIFTAAWELARHMASEAGTGSKAQFAAALRQTYQSVKEVSAYQADEAKRAAALREAHFEEIQEINTRLGKFGPRANAEKSRLQERRSALRAEMDRLAA